MSRTVQAELTTMVMVRRRDTGEVLVQQRAKSWKGIAFPGGHAEPGESLLACAVREIYEETGLRVSDLQSCGLVDWCCRATGDRYLVFLYRTQTFAGDLLDETEEGRVFWTDPASLHTLPLAENFERYWPLFFSPGELFAQWGDGEPDDFQVYPDKEAAVC